MVSILIHTVQIIGITVPFIGCDSFLRRVQSRTSIYLLLANLGCLIINRSYLLLLQTESYDGALTALKMEYFGNVVFYLVFAMFLWSYMKIKGREEYIQAGMSAYLSKPIDMDDIHRIVKKWIPDKILTIQNNM